MSKPSLDDALDKLRRAMHHFEIAKPKLEALEDQDAHTIRLKLDVDTGEYSFHVYDLEEPDPDLGLIVGDCVHNARASLDYLMVRLYSLVSGETPGLVKNVQFPISKDPQSFKDAVKCFSQYQLAKGYIARIEELQPYNNGNPSIWGLRPGTMMPAIHALPNALDRLSTLDNIDKHRIVHAVWGQVDIMRSIRSGGLIPPADFELIDQSISTAALKNGAQVGYLVFKTPLQSEWNPSEVDMKRAFPIQIALGEWPELYSAFTILAACLWGVESVLSLFEPVFARYDPPLPVTTIPNP